ncbi:Zinc Finger Protein 20 [Manis pentadactyla]|nr:Zinc Finger Protein 20 [Manis pentadactyla]
MGGGNRDSEKEAGGSGLWGSLKRRESLCEGGLVPWECSQQLISSISSVHSHRAAPKNVLRRGQLQLGPCMPFGSADARPQFAFALILCPFLVLSQVCGSSLFFLLFKPCRTFLSVCQSLYSAREEEPWLSRSEHWNQR